MRYARIFEEAAPNSIRAIKLSWLHSANLLPALFHATLSASASIVLAKTSSDEKLSRQMQHLHIEHSHQALHELGKDVAQAAFTPTDAHIFAMAYLAFQGGCPTVSEEPYPQSPLAEINGLYWASQFNDVTEHANAIHKCVKMRGGLPNIKLSALGKVLMW
jgi:hypothetical protein